LSMNRGEIKGEIVGVVKDFHDRSFHADISPVCIASFIPNYSFFATKINMASAAPTLASLEKAWNSAYPEQLYEYHFLEEQLEAFYKTEQLMLALISLFSFVAIFIGCLGLYGLVSFMVAQKTREIGIRKVLGGNLSDILWIFGKEFSRLILVALLIAAPLGWWIMSRWLEDYKFRITLGPGIILWTLLVSFGIALLAGGYQSFKAANANPAKSLKTE
jgi:putative ABC transport system permease protein